jgi:hypothetical protein
VVAHPPGERPAAGDEYVPVTWERDVSAFHAYFAPDGAPLATRRADRTITPAQGRLLVRGRDVILRSSVPAHDCPLVDHLLDAGLLAPIAARAQAYRTTPLGTLIASRPRP